MIRPQASGVRPETLDRVAAVYDDPYRLRFVAAADRAISSETLALFAAAPFRVSERSNRTGYRLSGPALPVTADSVPFSMMAA